MYDVIVLVSFDIHTHTYINIQCLCAAVYFQPLDRIQWLENQSPYKTEGWGRLVGWAYFRPSPLETRVGQLRKPRRRLRRQHMQAAALGHSGSLCMSRLGLGKNRERGGRARQGRQSWWCRRRCMQGGGQLGWGQWGIGKEEIGGRSWVGWAVARWWGCWYDGDDWRQGRRQWGGMVNRGGRGKKQSRGRRRNGSGTIL